MTHMPQKTLLLLLSALSLGLSQQACGNSTSYKTLLQQVEQQQPEKITTAGIQAVQAANQLLSQSWIAGDVTLKLHHENDHFTGDQAAQNWAVGAEFPVWLPSHKDALEGLSSSYQQQVTVQSAYLSWLASGKVRQLVWEYKKATIQRDAAQTAVEQSFILHDKVQERVTFGDRPELDLLLSQKTVLQQQALLAKAQSDFYIRQRQYQHWTQTTRLPDNITEAQQGDLALENHPQLLWLEAAYKISQAKLQQEKVLKTAAPSIYLGAQNDKDRVMDNTSLVLSVSIPLGLKSSNGVQIAEQQQAVLGQQAQKATAWFDLKQSQVAASEIVTSQRQSLEFVQQQVLLDQKALVVAEQAYQLGESSIQDLLLIQKQALESQLNLALSEADLGQSIAQYNQVMGYSVVDDKAMNGKVMGQASHEQMSSSLPFSEQAPSNRTPSNSFNLNSNLSNSVGTASGAR